MTEGAPKKTPDEAEAPAAPAAGASQSLPPSAGSNVPASSYGYPPHGGQAQPPPAAPAAAHPENAQAQAQAPQAQAAGVEYQPTFPDPAAAPNAATGSGGDGTQTSNQSQAQKGDKPAAPSAAAGGTSSSNSGSRSTTPSKQTSTAAAASISGGVAAASSSANADAAASAPTDNKDKTTPPAPKPREYQPSPQSDDPNASPCGLMRLTANKADKALYNYVRAVLGDLGEDGKSVKTAGVGSVGGGSSRGAASPGKAAPVSLSLLRPSAALLTVVLLLLGAEEVKGDTSAAKMDGGDESPPVGSIANFFSQHLSDLVAYCRTLDDSITIMDIVTFCLNFVKMGSSDDGASGTSNTTHIQRLRMALLKHEGCKGIAVEGTFSKTLQETLIAVFEAMSAQVRSDAEDSGDFTYLWEKCSKVHRRDFARAFLGTSGYESRHEALAEASRCAYVMDRYYRRGANLDNVGNKDAVEQRIKRTVTKAACIALVYRCGYMEKEVREMDEKAHAEYEKSAGENGGASSGAHGGKSVRPRKKDSRADMPIPSPSKPTSTAKDANNDIIMEDSDSQRPQSYYAGSHRAPKTSQSIEAETLDALDAMIENVDGEDASSKQGALPLDIIDTLVAATNELVAFLRSPNTGLSSVPNSPAAKTDASKYEVTASQIEEEMAKFYSAFSVDKKHFTALHSNLLEDTDKVQHDATNTRGTAFLGDLVPFLCSHWARFESGKVFTSLYFYKLIHGEKSPQSKVTGKIRAFFASPGLIEYTDNHGSFVQSSYIRYEALRAVAPTIRAGLVSSDKSILAQTPVAKVAILDLSTLEPFQGGADLFAESIIKPMEENEWINSLLLDISRAKAIKPSTRLRLYLRSGGRSEQGGEDQWKDVMFLILNKVLGQIFGRYFDLSPSPSPSSEFISEGTSKINLGPNGELNLAGIKANMKVPEPITDDAFGAALLALYYFSLEAILFDESARLKTSKHPKLILNPGFHRALLSVCSTCLLRAIGVQSGTQIFDGNISVAANGKTDVLSVLELTRCSPYDYLKVSEIFLRSSEQAIFGGLPANIRQHINEIDDYLIQQPLWATSPLGSAKCKTLLNEVDSLLSGLQNTGTGPTAKYWPVASLMPTIGGEQDNMAAIGHLKCEAETPPESSHLSNEYKYVDYLFRRMSLLASKRVSSLCTELSFPASVASEIWLAFRYVLRSQTFLLQDRHMDHVIVATTYAICKRLGLDPTNNLFSRIAAVYVAINKDFISERSCHHLLQRVKINSPKGYGNVIDFYNKVYVHAMKSYLLNSSTLRATAVEIKTLSGSARPQASPKAVDQRHAYQIQGTNVFVGKRHRSAESITGESKRARAIYSFGDPGRRDITVAQKLVTKN